jgi:hypothetical protein
MIPSDHWAKLDTILAATLEPSGPEWFTLKEFIARYNVSRPTARYRIDKMQQEGRIEVWAGGKTNKYRVV